jgi:hypothetical protein
VTSSDGSLLSSTAVLSFWSRKRGECIEIPNTKRAYRLDAPVEILFEIRSDDIGLERRKTGHLRDGVVEVHETLGHKVCLFAAVGALVRRAVHKCDVGADESGTGTPLRSVRRNFAEEE